VGVTEFGALLLELLDRKGLSCYEIGEASGLGADTISKLVNGHRPPTERHILRLIPPLLMTDDDIESANRLLTIGDVYIFRKPRSRRSPD